MRSRVVWLASSVCLLLGVVAGMFLGQSSPTTHAGDGRVRDRPSTGREAGALGASGPGEPESRDPARFASRPSSVSAADPGEPGSGDDESDPEGSRGEAEATLWAGDPEDEIERLRQQVAALTDERRELMGDPVDPAPGGDPRFQGPTLAAAVRAGLVGAGVAGDIEATDCSEHPCIVFGRLEGDEEDMEEVERAAALSPYKGDVLTLLFWATSIESSARGTPETGLFALAFYTFEDRAQRGEQLDRRIRMRTMEYWNSDRPGPQAAQPP